MPKGRTIAQKVLTYGIRHVEWLRYSVIACVLIFFVVLILVYTGLYSDYGVLFLGAVMLTGVILYAVYQPAGRFREIMDVLKPNLLDVEWVYQYTIKFTSAKQGEFYLYYYRGSENKEPAHYDVWISSDKKGPIMDTRGVALWKRPYKSILGKWLYFQSPPYVPVLKASEIKTLRWISMDRAGSDYRIKARLTDAWLQSETDDLLKTVELLEEIYAKM